MKKFLKVLGFAAAAAAFVPCRAVKDEETGRKSFQSLLCRLDIGPGRNGEGTDIRLSLNDGVLPSALRAARGETPDWDDEFDVDEDDFDELDPQSEPIVEVSLSVCKDEPCEPNESSETPEPEV